MVTDRTLIDTSGDDRRTAATANRPSEEIYLDANATTQVLPQAAAAALETMSKMFGNPSSSHTTGLRARYILDSTRQLAKQALGARRGHVIFTSGATEAIQTAVVSAFVRAADKQRRGDRTPIRALYGATEHKAVPESLCHWSRVLGLDVEILAIPVDSRGLLDMEFLERHASNACLVCTMAVNNETGVIQDLAAVEEVLRTRDPETLWLVDCVQALAKIDLDLAATTIDFATFSGHKLFAPKGIGVLYLRDQAPFTPLIIGGGQEHGRRSGTENLPGVAAIRAVLELLLDEHDTTFKDHATLVGFRDRLVASLRQTFPNLVLNTPLDQAVPTTINFAVEGFASKEILDVFDAAGIRVSSGSACGSAAARSYVLDAMGLPAWRSAGAVRMSFGAASSKTFIDDACARILDAGRALRSSCRVLASEIPQHQRQRLDGLTQLKTGNDCTWIHTCADAGTCVVIDLATELVDRIADFIACQDLRLSAVLATRHRDAQEATRQRLIERLGKRAEALASAADALGWPLEDSGSITLGDNSEARYLTLDRGKVLAVIHMPGTARDTYAYLLGTLADRDVLAPADVHLAFCGDAVVAGGLGRCDGPDGDPACLLDSLRRLGRLVGDKTLICPAHDPANGFVTRLGLELRQVPPEALAGDPEASASFVRDKLRQDRDLPPGQAAGLLMTDERGSLDLQNLADFLTEHRQALVIDVREGAEHRLGHQASFLGLSEEPRNVPLTRLPQLAYELLNANDTPDHRELVFVCRSGKRSAQAALALRRLGIASTWQVAGGLALYGTHA